MIDLEGHLNRSMRFVPTRLLLRKPPPTSTNIELVALSDAVAQLRTVPVEEYQRYGVLFG